MGGKALLLVVMGFSIIYLVKGKNYGDITNRAVINVVDYNNETIAHNIAVSGANMAANEIFLDPTWSAGFSNIDYQQGILNVNLQIVDAVQNIRKITSVGYYNGTNDTVTVMLQPSKFSKFAYFSVVEPSGIWWTSGDTVWGPFHTQDYLRISRYPVFYGKVTTKRGIKYNSGYNNPKFYGGYEKGVSLPLPSTAINELENYADENGKKFTNHDTVYVTFDDDTIKYKYSWNGTQYSAYGPSMAPNGVIFIKNAIARVSGTVKGRYSLVASGSGSDGRIYIDNDIVYKTNPQDNPDSDDMLGIIAKNSVYVTDIEPNYDDVNIHASIFCETGGFGAQNYSSRPVSGSINLLGGIIQYEREAVGTFSSWTGQITAGFSKSYKYDNRFMVDSPPMFPGTNSFEIVSWLE